MGPGRLNHAEKVVHRFHKSESCLFHSVHRFRVDFLRPDGAAASVSRAILTLTMA